MKRSNCKTKGKRFESLIADYIHTFFFDKYKPYRDLYTSVDNENVKPKRDPSSGTFTNSDGDIDLGILKKYFNVSVECKHHKDMNYSINSILSDKISGMRNIYFKQAKPNAEGVGLLPLVVFRANRTKIFCLFEYALFNISVEQVKSYSFVNIKDGMCIMLFSNFLEVYLENNKG